MSRSPRHGRPRLPRQSRPPSAPARVRCAARIWRRRRARSLGCVPCPLPWLCGSAAACCPVSVNCHSIGSRAADNTPLQPQGRGEICARNRDFPARIRCICKERGIEIGGIIPSNRRPGVAPAIAAQMFGSMRKEPAGASEGRPKGPRDGRSFMASVAIRDVRKAFGAIEVIHGVDVLIDDGEFVVLVGPSGCGKSTLLRMIAGLENITSGEIRIGERVVNRVPPKERDIAMVFQNYALYPHMTVAANMGFSL